jgi:hypothetical protein
VGSSGLVKEGPSRQPIAQVLDLQVVAGLEVPPEPLGRPKGPRRPAGRIRCRRPLTVNDLERTKEPPRQDLARRHGGHPARSAAEELLQRVQEALAKAQDKYAQSLQGGTVQMTIWEQHGTKIMATAGAMGAAVLAFGSKAVSAFSESEKVTAQLDAVLKSTGGSAGVTKQQVLGLADALSKVTPFDDEVILQGENLLLTFTNIGKNVFPRAIETALDLATALGEDVPDVSKMKKQR